MVKKLFLLLVHLAVFHSTIACASVADAKGEAERVAMRYFGAVQADQFDEVLPLYAPEFFDKTPRDVWLQFLKNVNTRLGNLKSYELIRWEVRANVSSVRTGTITILEYKATYSKQTAVERLTIFRPSQGGEAKILGHNITWDPF